MPSLYLCKLLQMFKENMQVNFVAKKQPPNGREGIQWRAVCLTITAYTIMEDDKGNYHVSFYYTQHIGGTLVEKV